MQIAEALREITSEMRRMSEQLHLLAQSNADVQFTFQCIAFALGNMQAADADRFRHDFLRCSELLWRPPTQTPPQWVTNLLMQYTAGVQHRQRGID